MEELTLTTPSILFSAISLIMLAYTNRFLAYAQVIRNLKGEHENRPSTMTKLQLIIYGSGFTWLGRCKFTG